MIVLRYCSFSGSFTLKKLSSRGLHSGTASWKQDLSVESSLIFLALDGGLFQQQHFPEVAHQSMPLLHFWPAALSRSPLQKKDVRMRRFIQEVNTTTRSCALWDLDEDTEYIVHVQSISMGGSSPPSEPVLFRTPKESEKMASKSPGEGGVTGSDCLYATSFGDDGLV